MSDDVVPGAGGVVTNAAGQILILKYPPARGGNWTFPKGHVEPGETLEQAAVREVREECGVRANITRALGQTDYTNPRGIRRRIHWFAMSTRDADPKAEPGFEARFVAPDEAEGYLAHDEDRALLQRLASGGDA